MTTKFQPRISMITLGVDDMERAVAFYRDGLGFPKIDSSPSVAFFDLNGSWLGLFGRQALAEDGGVPAEGSGFGGTALAYNVSAPEDVDALYSHALSVGATGTKAPQKAFWGGYHAYFSDPDGHLWEIAYNPFGWIGPQDAGAQ